MRTGVLFSACLVPILFAQGVLAASVVESALHTESEWTAEVQQQALSLIRRVLSNRDAHTDRGFLPEIVRRPSIHRVYLTVFWKGRPSLQVGYEGKTPADALEGAARELADRHTKFPHLAPAIREGRIMVDVEIQRSPFRPLSTRSLFSQIVIGLDGLTIQESRTTSTFLPLTLQRHASDLDPVASLFSEAGLPVPNLFSEATRMERFRTVSFIEESPNGRALSLYRGNVLLEDVTQRDILHSLLQCGAWLLRIQRADGTFLYEYDPMMLRSTSDYNIVRHAAMMIPLYMLYGITKDEKDRKDERFLEAGDRCLQYTKRFLREGRGIPFVIKKGTDPNFRLPFSYVRYKGESPLGATAVLLQGLARRAEATGQVEDIGLMEQLGNFIRVMTLPDGRVYPNFELCLQQRMPSEQPKYYPGEAMLALCLLHRHLPRPEWLVCAERIAEFQISEFVRGQEPDHWVIIGLMELYRLTENKKYAELCLRMADVYCEQQILPGQTPYRDFVGGFTPRELPSVTGAACRSEALYAAYIVAALTQREVWKYADAILLSARFQMQQQFRPENSFFVEDAELVLGAYRRDPIQMDVRIDFAQHGITSLIGAAAVAGEKEAAQKTSRESR